MAEDLSEWLARSRDGLTSADWPDGPFHKPPHGTYDLAQVEQMAAIAKALKQALIDDVRFGGEQRKLAIAAGVTETQVSRLFSSGKLPLGNIDWVLALAAALGLQLFPRPWPAPATGETPVRRQWPDRAQPESVDALYPELTEESPGRAKRRIALEEQQERLSKFD